MPDVSLADLEKLIENKVRQLSMPSDTDLKKLMQKAANYQEWIAALPAARCLDGSCGAIHRNEHFSPSNVSTCEEGHCYPASFPECPWCASFDVDDVDDVE